MSTDAYSRREFSLRAAALIAFGPIAGVRQGGEVTHDAESIHQEVTINASRARVYRALTDAAQFSAMTKFSMVPKAVPAVIGRDAGSAFALFDGHIVGRQLELVPDQRIVQAWRVADWAPGIFSIARFELKEQGAKTTIVFDHTGFPKGLGRHLAEGWHANYWTPLQKSLS